MLVDAHTHVFCWGENPADGYLSERTRKSWLTRLLMKLIGIAREPGETLSDKMRSRLLRQVRESKLDRCIVLAQDAVYREDGSRDDAATHFYVSNDYVLDLANRCERILPGCSINPWRRDALAGPGLVGLPAGAVEPGPLCRHLAAAALVGQLPADADAGLAVDDADAGAGDPADVPGR